MLARIANGLFWLGRNLARAEHTARMIDGVTRLQLQGRADDDPAGVTLDWRGASVVMGVQPAADPAASLRRLALDAGEPASIAACLGRAREGARTVRDVLSAEMWEAINTTTLQLPRDDPWLVPNYVRQRCALFWGLTGRTMLRDEAHAFLRAGSRLEASDMLLRMLRVALQSVRGESGQAVALLHAVGGAQAFRRSGPAPPETMPVVRFLLYESAYPDSVAASVEALLRALQEADADPRRSAPVLRLQRLAADLDFRRRAVEDEDLVRTCEAVQAELARVDRDIAERYFAGALEAA
jgi:uncharacterized alpha-E superfamily protein